MRLIDAVDQHHDAREAQRLEDALELGQQLVAVVGALFARQRLAGDVDGGNFIRICRNGLTTCLPTRMLRAIVAACQKRRAKRANQGSQAAAAITYGQGVSSQSQRSR